MADADKMENCVTETQETCYEKDEKDTSGVDQTLSFNESQDFRLVDSEDETLDKSQVEQANSERKEKEELDSSQTEEPSVDLGKERLEESGVPESLDNTNDKINDKSNLESSGKLSDEEDVIQATPPQNYSPRKKQANSSSDSPSLKRKLESSFESTSKLLRTLSGEGALHFERKKVEEDDSFKSDNSQQDFPNSCLQANVIIEETQDTTEEPTQERTENPDSSKSEILKENADQSRSDLSQVCEESSEKRYEIDKNENVSSPKKCGAVESADEDCTLTKTTEAVESSGADLIVLEAEGKKDASATEDSDKTFKVAEDKGSERLASEKDAENVPNDRNVISESSPRKEVTTENHSTATPTCKPRNSVELIYDRSCSLRGAVSKPKHLIQIDEEGEKIVLDSSQEESQKSNEGNNDTVYKSCYESSKSSDLSYKSLASTNDSSNTDNRLVNGSSESRKDDTDTTVSLNSDLFSKDSPAVLSKNNNTSTSVFTTNKQAKVSSSKDAENVEVVNISDKEPDISITDENLMNKSDLNRTNSLVKSLQVEREIGMYVKLKCLLHVDEGTKEFLSKEVIAVHCEPVVESSSGRQKNDDTSASLADISGNDNKDASPGSVNSNPQMYHLNPCRLSSVSTISSSSSASSAASLAAKLAARDGMHFSLPRGFPKHVKKQSHDQPVDKQLTDETYERLTKEWNNSRLLTATILNFVNAELTSVDTYNVSNERLDEQLQKIRSSTPETSMEIAIQNATPKSTKKGKASKRPRSKTSRANVAKIAAPASADIVGTPTKRKKTKSENVESNAAGNAAVTPVVSQNITSDELIGKEVFAKWSDNNYYPGMVTEKIKTKYKVNYYDGESKVLIEDFIIPIPKTLNEGLSVYAFTDNYGTPGIIVDVRKEENGDVNYTVETDDGEKLTVQIKHIFLSADQAQLLKESNAESRSLPSTPKHLGQVTLENMVDGKRRSARKAGTPLFSTPKSRGAIRSPAVTSVEPSVSGLAAKFKKETKVSDSEGVSSDSSLPKEETLSGVQPEIIGTPNRQLVKGPQSRIKGKPRSKRKQEDEETIATLGPIPPANSTLFKGMSFMLTCASLDGIDRYKDESGDSSSETGTENEEEWARIPFVMDRLKEQIIAGGGVVYSDFSSIPKEEYKNTKLITNVPNRTAKSLCCLSVGIPAYNHKWIIRCCQENKLVKPSEDVLPAGWSFDKHSYVEMFERPDTKPLSQVVVIIPNLSDKQFISFWRQICENAGAVVILAENPGNMEGFVEGTVVVTNQKCPSWAVERATDLQIPLLSTTWVIQCLIEGKICPYDTQERYKYNCIEH